MHICNKICCKFATQPQALRRHANLIRHTALCLERWGLSYVVVFERSIEDFAPVVARLAGHVIDLDSDRLLRMLTVCRGEDHAVGSMRADGATPGSPNALASA